MSSQLGAGSLSGDVFAVPEGGVWSPPSGAAEPYTMSFQVEAYSSSILAISQKMSSKLGALFSQPWLACHSQGQGPGPHPRETNSHHQQNEAPSWELVFLMATKMPQQSALRSSMQWWWRDQGRRRRVSELRSEGVLARINPPGAFKCLPHKASSHSSIRRGRWLAGAVQSRAEPSR